MITKYIRRGHIKAFLSKKQLVSSVFWFLWCYFGRDIFTFCLVSEETTKFKSKVLPCYRVYGHKQISYVGTLRLKSFYVASDRDGGFRRHDDGDDRTSGDWRKKDDRPSTFGQRGEDD